MDPRAVDRAACRAGFLEDARARLPRAGAVVGPKDGRTHLAFHLKHITEEGWYKQHCLSAWLDIQQIGFGELENLNLCVDSSTNKLKTIASDKGSPHNVKNTHAKCPMPRRNARS